MGGHGGLNILPQKKWNVYNFDNREKVRKDEEAAARDEQQKRADSRRRDSELRLQQLRQSRGLPNPTNPSTSAADVDVEPAPADAAAAPAADVEAPGAADWGHINLFGGLVGFEALGAAARPEERRGGKKFKKEESEGPKKRRREEEKVVVGPEDEKYKLGYGLVGKGVKAPWYASRPSFELEVESGGDEGIGGIGKERRGGGSSGKKSIEELREERLRREKKEHGRERAVRGSLMRERVDRHSDRYYDRCSDRQSERRHRW